MLERDDIPLAREIQQGSREAFRVLFDRYYQRLVAYVATLTHDSSSAEDIVQEAFVTLWTRREVLDTSKSPKSYLYTIAYHGYIDQYRKAKDGDDLLEILKQEALQGYVLEDNTLQEERIEKLQKIIKTLPPRCRQILTMNKMEGMKYKQIAEMLGISVKTVEAQMRIAFGKIRDGLVSR